MDLAEGVGGDKREQDSWQKISTALLAIVGLGCLHGLLYHLHVVIVPFLLGGFIVLALQPTVDILYRLLAGLVGPGRWCCCCCQRRRTGVWSPPAAWSPAASRKFGGLGKDEACCGVKQDSCLGRSTTERTPLLETTRSQEDSSEYDEYDDDLDHGFVSEGCCVQFMDSLCRGVAVTLVFLAMCCLVILVILGLAHGAMHVRQSWGSYADGLRRVEAMQHRLMDRMIDMFHLGHGKTMAEAEALQHAALKRMQESIWEVASYIVQGTSDGVTAFSLMLLYVLFWLYQPLPTGGKVGIVVRSYLFLKTICSAGLGIAVAISFGLLGIDLCILFGMIAFFLNFVPEIGSVISILVPIPVILLDGSLEDPFRVLLMATFLQGMWKFIFCNIVEVKLIEMDKEMHIHPVWVIGGLSYFGYIWGPIGMLISVPLLALTKAAAMSASILFPDDPDMPRLADLFLACLEGRRPGKPAWRGKKPAGDDVDVISECDSPRVPIQIPMRLSSRGSSKSRQSTDRIGEP
eukprot:TRINITY_DN91163_c0_g1_i1.p1 TRINITY_DN91163_c0_g1~~TRINITY_DN91163_c0_g1_i1.p1  ORF type:complete len:518 (+),score=66.16 TRINITY_DN91163_c0_g1_i1:108-1661(+)